MRLGIRATWNGAADFSAAIRRAVFSGLSSIGVSLAEPSSVIRQIIKVQNMASIHRSNREKTEIFLSDFFLFVFWVRCIPHGPGGGGGGGSWSLNAPDLPRSN